MVIARRWIGLLLGAALGSAAAQALPPPPPPSDAAAEIGRQGEATLEAAKKEHAATYERLQAQGASIIEQRMQQEAAAATPPASGDAAKPVSQVPATGRGYRLYVSQSMPDAELAAAALLATREPRLVLIFRGVGPDQSLTQLAQKMQALAQVEAVGDPVPAMEIDPIKFAEDAITAIPTLAATEDGKTLAQARGVIRPAWIEERLARGDHGDLGKHGTTYDILEADLMAVLKAKIESIAAQQDPERAVTNYFDRIGFIALPPATAPRVRRIDPTIVVQQTIKAMDGTVLAHQGERINPLSRVPLRERVAVFDGRSPSQVAWAKKLMATPGKPLMLVTTQLPQPGAQAALLELTRAFDRRVYVLQPAMAERFQVQRVPTVIDSDATHYIITETPAHGPASPATE